MEIAVWDTYVKREDGKTMHFDILVPDNVTDEQTIISYGKHYLKTKTFKTDELTTKECRFCHIAQANVAIQTSISEKGYAILEMEHCNSFD